MIEIERKFLVKSEFFLPGGNSTQMKQGYLSIDPNRIVRIRIEGKNAWLTIKGRLEGISRPEFEYPVPPGDAEALLRLSLHPPVEKIRHRVEVNGTLWEVDEFLGLNKGLFLAEVELDSEEQLFSFPEWIGEEVTADHRYYNAWLSGHPYSTW